MSQFLAATQLLDAATTAMAGPSRFAREALAEVMPLHADTCEFGPDGFTVRYDEPGSLFLDGKITQKCDHCNRYHTFEVGISKHDGELWGAYIGENELGGKAERQFMSATAAFLQIVEELSYYGASMCNQE
jgi:hypothetical protein